MFRRQLRGHQQGDGGGGEERTHLPVFCLRVPVNIEGCSTHSFRRSALSAASDKGVPLKVIQSISGHSSLEMLQRYLDVKDEQKRQAALAFG